MKSDITPNSVDSVKPVNTANSDVAVNSNDRNTPDNNANLFNNEQSATPQPKQQRVGIKQRKLEFGEYKETYLIPVKIVKRHSLNISDATWERLAQTVAAMPSASSANTSTCSATTSRHGANSEN